MCVTYFGQKCQMKVIQITADAAHGHDVNVHNVSSLTQDVEQLHLSDFNESSNLNESDYHCSPYQISSTPNRERLKSPTKTPGKDNNSSTSTSPQKGDNSLNNSQFKTPAKQQPCQDIGDFYRVCSTTKCSLVREDSGGTEMPQASALMLCDIGGMKSQIAAIKETVMLPLKSPHLFSSSGWLNYIL